MLHMSPRVKMCIKDWQGGQGDGGDEETVSPRGQSVEVKRRRLQTKTTTQRNQKSGSGDGGGSGSGGDGTYLDSAASFHASQRRSWAAAAAASAGVSGGSAASAPGATRGSPIPGSSLLFEAVGVAIARGAGGGAAGGGAGRGEQGGLKRKEAP